MRLCAHTILRRTKWRLAENVLPATEQVKVACLIIPKRTIAPCVMARVGVIFAPGKELLQGRIAVIAQGDKLKYINCIIATGFTDKAWNY